MEDERKWEMEHGDNVLESQIQGRQTIDVIRSPCQAVTCLAYDGLTAAKPVTATKVPEEQMTL